MKNRASWYIISSQCHINFPPLPPHIVRGSCRGNLGGRTMPVTQLLTARSVELFHQKPLPEGKKKAKLSDGGGLQLVKRGNSSTWVLFFSMNKRRKEFSLGQYPDVSLANARTKATEARAKITDDINPIRERAERRRELETFGEYADKHLVQNRNKWGEKTEWQWNVDLTQKCASIRSKPIIEIDDSDIGRILKPIWLMNVESANRLHRRIRTIFDDAIADRLIDRNPADLNVLKRHHLPDRGKLPEKHHASIPYADIPEFIASVRERRGLSAAALELVCLTVLRSQELRGGQWREIDFANRVWTVPAERMKERKEHRVPLSERAIEILSEIKPKRPTSSFIFPGPGSNGFISEAGLRRMLKKTKCGENATIHGFRSSFRTWAEEQTAYPHAMKEMALAHKVWNDVERAYSRTDMLQRRFDLMSSWAAFCDGQDTSYLLGGDNVILFRSEG